MPEKERLFTLFDKHCKELKGVIQNYEYQELINKGEYDLREHKDWAELIADIKGDFILSDRETAAFALTVRDITSSEAHQSTN